LPKNIDGIFETAKFSITVVIGLIGILALFMGLLSIAEQAGGINLISRLISPFLNKLFPSIPVGHASYGHMVMNFSANLLGLDNAATPFGLKAMQSLQEINSDKEKASDAQIMFLSLHAAGLTIIPVSIIAIRAANGSHNPNEVFIPLIFSTFVCTMTALLVTSFKQRINVLQPKLFLPLFSLTALIGVFVWFLKSLPAYGLETFSDAFSNGAILLVFLAVVLGGLYKKINLFDAFVEGAKGGFETAVRIIPYMVGMLVAVCMLRTSGAFELLITPIKNLIASSGMDAQWAEGIPVALLRPFSAGGARGFMIDAMRTYGADSFIGKLVSVLQGSSETTFYVVALYYGSVSIKDTRYSIPVMLLADLAGVIFSIGICYYLFG
jgi:spore maturation protein SpmA/spore maturation protein SpmB